MTLSMLIIALTVLAILIAVYGFLTWRRSLRKQDRESSRLLETNSPERGAA